MGALDVQHAAFALESALRTGQGRADLAELRHQAHSACGDLRDWLGDPA